MKIHTITIKHLLEEIKVRKLRIAMFKTAVNNDIQAERYQAEITATEIEIDAFEQSIKHLESLLSSVEDNEQFSAKYAKCATGRELDILRDWLGKNIHNKAIFRVAAKDEQIRLILCKLPTFQWMGAVWKVTHGFDINGCKDPSVTTIERVSE